MEIVAPLEANEKSSVAVQPGEVAFDDPAMAAERGAGLDTLASNAWGDVPTAEGSTPRAGLIRLVGVELVRASTRSAAWALDGRDLVNEIQEHGALVDVRASQAADQRDALPLAHHMVLRPWSAAISRARADVLGRWPPFFAPLAGTVELSMLARLQSIRSALPNRSRSTRCNRCQTPACCQSRSRRQQVIPLPQPISRGRYSHGIPVVSTNTIPLKHARSGTRGRPGFFFGRGSGSKGSTTFHNSSLTSGVAMQQTSQGSSHFC